MSCALEKNWSQLGPQLDELRSLSELDRKTWLTALAQRDAARASTPYNNAGLVLLLMGRFVAAESKLGQSLRLVRQPGAAEGPSAASLANHGRALAGLGRFAEAALMLEQAQTLADAKAQKMPGRLIR